MNFKRLNDKRDREKYKKFLAKKRMVEKMDREKNQKIFLGPESDKLVLPKKSFFENFKNFFTK